MTSPEGNPSERYETVTTTFAALVSLLDVRVGLDDDGSALPKPIRVDFDAITV